ncbi:MAG TPA: hypothetical protein VFV99_12280, partial [Kofleriaceae bacterium]|nr:hypothetical protein [Kofleriaceae bacterium]
SNLILICDGHHKLLHEGIVTITGAAPDQLVFTRDGRQLVDPRSPAAIGQAMTLRETAAVTETVSPKPRSRFADAVRYEQAKQALKGLGFKATLAKQLLEEALTHVGQDAEVSTIVEKVLAMNRATTTADVIEDQSKGMLAKRALVQSGYAPALAEAAVEAALTRVGSDKPLETLIMEAFRRCCEG